MAKAKHVKLGEKASIFFDPTSKTKVTPNQAVELTKEAKASKRVIKAIKSGHLDYVHDGEMDDLKIVTIDDQNKKAPVKKGEENKKKVEPETGNEGDEDDEEWDEKKLMKLKKPELVAMAKENESEYSDEELGELTKEELSEEILGLLEGDE